MNKIGTKIIDTERCILRRIVPDDYQMMYENWAKYEEVCRYFPFNPVTDMEIYKEKVHKWADNYESDTDIFIFTCIVCIGCRGIFFIILVFRHRINSFFTYNIAAAVSDGKIIIRYSACKDKFSPVFSFFFKI